MSQENVTLPAELVPLDKFSKLLDSQFRIPGTSIRFGADFVIGLVPYAGDLISFLFSAGLVLTMARYGASGQLIARMLGNVVLDTTIGSIPLIGDIFDLFFKSNRRNFHLLEKHYGKGAYKGSIWKVIIPVLIILILLFILMIWFVIWVLAYAWSGIFS